MSLNDIQRQLLVELYRLHEDYPIAEFEVIVHPSGLKIRAVIGSVYPRERDSVLPRGTEEDVDVLRQAGLVSITISGPRLRRVSLTDIGLGFGSELMLMARAEPPKPPMVYSEPPKPPNPYEKMPPLPSKIPPLPSKIPPLPSKIPPLPSKIPPLPSRKKPRSEEAVSTPAKRVFIGHGRSKDWLELALKLRQWDVEYDEFNTGSAAGRGIQDRLNQMLDHTSLGLLVMTAEDEDADGNVHARENVIHEAGLWAGRHGFDNSVLLIEEGCGKFSNSAGLVYLEFPKGKIKHVFHAVDELLIDKGFMEPRRARK